MTNDILDGLTPTDAPEMSRVWDDANFNGVVDGDPLLVRANGELIRNDGNPAFGQPIITARVDPDWATGWGTRGANWEYSAGVQHELRPNTSVSLGYFYRTFINVGAVDDRNLSPEDYDTYSVVVPRDPRLPDGGGYTIRGLRDRKLSALGRAPDNVRTSADAFGGSTQTWRGLDVTMDARLDRLLLQGGVSTGGRHSTTASCRGGCRRGSAPASSAARRRST